MDFNPFDGQFGARVNGLAQYYSKFKFKKVVVRWMSYDGDNTNSTVLGIKDDISISGDDPTTAIQISQFRCSSTDHVTNSEPMIMEYIPQSRDWFYVGLSEGSANTRFTSAGALFGGKTSSGAPSIISAEVFYTLVLSGGTAV
jgi:hypothetical protein